MLCSDASPVHPVLKDLLLTADVITPMVCTDASPVQPVLKTWLLRDLHRLWNTVRPMHRCPFLNHRFISGAYKLTWLRFLSAPKYHGVGSSDNHRMHRCSCVGSSGATDRRALLRFSLSSLESKILRMIILTIILVQVLCCHSITKITRNGINGAMFVSLWFSEKGNYRG